MKLNFIFFLGILYCLSGAVYAEAEWIFRDLKANTLTSPRCQSKTDAIDDASKSTNVERYAKRFCQLQGYGWHLTEVKDNGNPICDQCPSNSSEIKYRCHLQDVVATCKRLKPGSVGMLPNEITDN